MQKASRNMPEVIDDPGLRPYGAPRGLLHFYALLSIARMPMRGYDLMKEIEVKTEGAWRPGPGAVYPVLQKLARQGLVAAKKPDDGSTQVMYEITPTGLERIADAKKMMRSSTERMGLVSSLFVDLMEPEDTVRFVLNAFDAYIQLVHTIVEAERSELTDEDRLFLMSQYKLNLERELSRAAAAIKQLSGKAEPRDSRREKGTQHRGRA